MAESLPVYLVGGPVRDVLLGAPTTDLDFVLEGDAPQLASELARELGWHLVVHDRFGTATVSHEDCHIDLVTARQEVYSAPGALPEVSPGTIHDDLARRDFSINTLALPLFQSVPQPIDEHHGIDELGKGLIRTLHPLSFADDPTRMLRAVRYEQRFGFALEIESKAHLRHALASGYMDAVSGDRLRHELERILAEQHPGPALARAIDLGVLKAIHPALIDQTPILSLDSRSSGDNHSSSMLYLAALAYPLSSQDAEGVIQRFNLPGHWAKVVQDTGELRQLVPQFSSATLPNSEICQLLEGRSEEAIAAVSQIGRPGVVSQRLDLYLTELCQVNPILDGDSMLAMGVTEGPLVGRILGKLRTAKLDRLVESEEDERQLVRRILAGREDV
ncbi:MAG: hypothetical protein BZY73_04835 [SAR202 cluster bacterium Casp-Chloro-G3]|nr:MAG: hypothetical protein BZY73_04835 [SAR202 cluster bacterium Casp-Chloro-G3]